MPEQERRPATALSRFEVTASSIRVYDISDTPVPDPAQGGSGSTYNMIPQSFVCSRLATARPETLSPFLNVADHVPVSARGPSSPSDNRAVPSPATASVIVPDQVPTGETTVGGVGAAGGPSSPHPKALTITARTKASRRRRLVTC